MSAIAKISPEYVQGTKEWLAFRKAHITATDASVILGESPWKTALKLYYEKLSDESPIVKTEAMQRGLDLEPIAREFFTMKTGIKLIPKDDPRNVVINPERNWMMASFDGVSECGEITLEIKCPGLSSQDHALAQKGEISKIYFPQVQHQIEVKKPNAHFYMVFDGFDGPIFEVKRDQKYIEKLLDEEFKFYQCIINKTPPEPCEGDYIERTDSIWEQVAYKWKNVTKAIKDLEKEENQLRQQLIFLSGESNSKGGGISLCQVQRKGTVDYSKIPELKNVDLEKYRKTSMQSWRITTQ